MGEEQDNTLSACYSLALKSSLGQARPCLKGPASTSPPPPKPRSPLHCLLLMRTNILQADCAPGSQSPPIRGGQSQRAPPLTVGDPPLTARPGVHTQTRSRRGGGMLPAQNTEPCLAVTTNIEKHEPSEHGNRYGLRKQFLYHLSFKKNWNRLACDRYLRGRELLVGGAEEDGRAMSDRNNWEACRRVVMRYH